jgi:thymidylate synthase (FAD)
MKVELVALTTGIGKYADLNSEEIVSAIARHGIIKEDNGKLIKYLMDHKHVSPLDMINYVFEIETSLSIGRQLLRHASIKPQEHSLRYAKSIGFEPIELRKEDPKNRQSSTEVYNPTIEDTYGLFEGIPIPASDLINQVLNIVQDCYQELIKAGVAKECARFILPNCTTTIMTFNGTLRSWLSLLNVRCDFHSQQEIRIIANLIGEELEKSLPNVFTNIDWKNGMFL